MATTKTKMGIVERIMLYIIGPVLIIGGIWALWYYLGVRQIERFPVPKEGKKYEDAAAYGDSFGGLNTLFSGLAFGGVIYAIVLQMIELRYQREELIANREELKKTADANTQLVKLNALTALSEYYLNHAARDESTVINEFNRAILERPEQVKKTVTYKLSNCINMLELLYADLSGDPVGDPALMDLDFERKWQWHKEFAFHAGQLDSCWTTSKAQDADAFQESIPVSDVIAYLKRFYGNLTFLVDCIDAIGEEDGEYRQPIEKATADARQLGESIDHRQQLQSDDWAVGQRIASELRPLIERSVEFRNSPRTRNFPFNRRF